MKKLIALFMFCFLLAGCSGISKKEVVGVYMIRVDNVSGTLDLKNDDTYVQTLAITGSAAGARNGKWRFAKDGDHTYVILEKAFYLEECPQCALTPRDSVTLHLSAGEMNIFLAQDSVQSKVVYSK
jgi:hypothetical protein